MPTLSEVREELHAKSKALDEIFQQAGPDLDMTKVTTLEGDTVAKAAEIRRRNDELTELGTRFDELHALDSAAQKNRERYRFLNEPAGRPQFAPEVTNGRSGGAAQPEQKSLGEWFTEAPEYKAGLTMSRPNFGIEIPDLTLKTTVSLAAGFTQPAFRTNIVIPSAQRRPVVADLIPQDETTYNAIRFMQETTFTNNAAAVAESGTKPESALAWTEVTVPVQTLAHLLPITRQQLEDVPAIRGIIEGRLTLMLALAEETELVTGSGTPPHLTGLLNVSGIQTQARGSDPIPDAVFKAFTLIRYTGFAEPSGMVIHPNNWMQFRLLRTADGVYIWGTPADDGPERIWGKPVIVTTAMTAGTAIIADFVNYTHISRRMGLTLDVTDSHASTFAQNILTLRMEERLSLETYRAAAIATVTGLP